MPKKKLNTPKRILKQTRDGVPNYTLAQLKERLESEMRSGSPAPFICIITDVDSRQKYGGVAVPVWAEKSAE
jgi:hypothetical protein